MFSSDTFFDKSMQVFFFTINNEKSSWIYFKI